MKMHLGLVVLACILVFDCTATKQNGVAGVIQTPAQQYGSPGATTIPDDKMCNPLSAKCRILIEMTVKDTKNGRIHAKITKIQKQENEEAPTPITSEKHENIVKPVNGIVGMGQIFFTRSSPDCVYYYYDGDWWYICW